MPEDSTVKHKVINHLDYYKGNKKSFPQFTRWYDRGRVTASIGATLGRQYSIGIK